MRTALSGPGHSKLIYTPVVGPECSALQTGDAEEARSHRDSASSMLTASSPPVSASSSELGTESSLPLAAPGVPEEENDVGYVGQTSTDPALEASMDCAPAASPDLDPVNKSAPDTAIEAPPSQTSGCGWPQ